MDLGRNDSLLWKSITNLKERTHKSITCNVAEAEVMYIGAVGSKDLLVFWHNLDSHVNMVIVERNS